jgi:D-serine deaminase-like pyridoxal phosphate-dependent protein
MVNWGRRLNNRGYLFGPVHVEFAMTYPSRISELPTPCLLLDLGRFECNARRMRDRMAQFAVSFRPHLKTAKSFDVARRVMDAAHGPAMVSTLREAEYYAFRGVRDLVYGVGIVAAKLDRVAAIRERHGADLVVILDSVEQAAAVASWSRANRHPLATLIEIDCDGHRSGVQPGNAEQLVSIGRVVEESGARLRGVLTHAGGSYAFHRAEDLAIAAAAERLAAVQAADALRAAGLPCPVVSIGSTPTARFVRDLAGVTEVRAGVFIFGDLIQAGIGTCQVSEIAVSVLATVIGHQHAKGRIIVDAGWMALSADRGTSRQRLDQGYGLVCDDACVPYPDLIVVDANQEHGIVGSRPGSGASPPDLPVGSLVRILPSHACSTCAQHDRYRVIAADAVIAEWPRANGW